MAHVTSNRVKETSTTTGTGSLTLAGALSGVWRPFSAVMVNNDTAFYGVEHQSANEWEVGLGTWQTGGILARTTVLASSNAGAAVNFSAGTKHVFITAPAERILQLDDALGVLLPDVTASQPTPTGALRLWAKNRAGRRLLNMMGPSGVDVGVQPALFSNHFALWLPGTGTTVGINFGTSFTARNSGTGAAQATPARASTNAMTQMARATFGTGTTTTGASGIQSAGTVAWRGNAAGLGGFFFHARFGVETSASDLRMFVGLSANNATIAADPSSWNHTIGIGKDTADSTWQVIRRDGTTATKVNTTCTVTAGQVLDVYLFCAPNDSKITVRLVDAFTGTVYIDNAEYTTTLPGNTTFLYMQAHIMSVTGTTAKLLALNKMYLESDS